MRRVMQVRGRRAILLARLLLAVLMPALAGCLIAASPTAVPTPPGATAPLPAPTPTANARPAPVATPVLRPPAPPAPPAETPATPPSDTPVPLLPTAPALPTGTIRPGPLGTPVPTAAGGDIVFVLSGTLAVVHADGSGLRRLPISGDLHSPRWAPDKARIAFLLGYGGAADLWMMNADGSDPRRLTSTPGIQEADPRWSPDGRVLAYTRTADTNGDGQFDTRDQSEVWLIAADGRHARRLADGLDPAWAPDGQRLAFVTNGRRDAANAYGQANTVDLINAQGANRWSPITIAGIPQDTRLVNPDAPFHAATTFLRYPAWAPGNHALAFVAGGHSGLIVTATDKGAAITLRAFDYEGGYGGVHWAPDGAKLLYEVLPPSGTDQVTALTLAGRHTVTFGSPFGDHPAASPAWAPDSLRIAFVQDGARPNPRAAPAGALAVARLDTPDTPQAIVPAGAAEPDWR